jgi:hypothetical protein
MSYLKSLFIGLVGAAVVLLAGCSPQLKHPNQINAFDGATYDSLTAAHAAMASLRGTVASQYPQYTSVFNGAVASYSVAYNSYAVYRATPVNEAAVALAVGNLTVSVVALENTIQTDLHVSPKTVSHIRGKALRLRAAAQPAITLSDILTELEIASGIAQAIPGAQPYAQLAALVIEATQKAVSAIDAASGQAIDLTLIQPIPAI